MGSEGGNSRATHAKEHTTHGRNEQTDDAWTDAHECSFETWPSNDRFRFFSFHIPAKKNTNGKGKKKQKRKKSNKNKHATQQPQPPSACLTIPLPSNAPLSISTRDDDGGGGGDNDRDDTHRRSSVFIVKDSTHRDKSSTSIRLSRRSRRK